MLVVFNETEALAACFFTFLGTSAAECYVSECTRGCNNWTGTSENGVSSRRDKHFFQKLAFGLDETPVTKIGGGGRGPTPGPRNLNENPALEELSEKNAMLQETQT